MRTPTTIERKRAAETLAAIARIDSLQGGVVIFEADGLRGGRWYEPGDRDGLLTTVWAPVPPVSDELGESCRSFLETAIEQHQDDVARAASAAAERDELRARRLRQLLYDD